MQFSSSARYRHGSTTVCAALVGLFGCLALAASGVVRAETTAPSTNAARLASQVLIYRDSYGTPHIDGANDSATVFGFAYAQAEDFFWQIEDTYILGLGATPRCWAPKG